MLDELSVETLSQIFNPEYLYETNKIVVYLGKLTQDDVEKSYQELVTMLADGSSRCDKSEYVLALLNDMSGYDENDFETPIGEMITFVQWWVEGLRKHVTSGNKNRRYFETECFEIEFIHLN